MRISKSEKDFPEYEGPESTAKKRKKEEKHKQWKEKQLHSKFVRETKEAKSEELCRWIKKDYLKREAKDLIFAAQEQALRTN